MFQAYGTISDGNIYHIGIKMAITWLPSQPLPQTFSIYRSKIQAILSMKSPNIPKNNTFLSKQMPWVIIKNGKSIWGKIYIVTSYEMMCLQFLVNGNRYDKNKNTRVYITCRTISEVNISFIVWEMALVWLLSLPPNPKFYNFSQFATWFCSSYCKYLRYTSHFCFL